MRKTETEDPQKKGGSHLLSAHPPPVSAKKRGGRKKQYSKEGRERAIFSKEVNYSIELCPMKSFFRRKKKKKTSIYHSLGP